MTIIDEINKGVTEFVRYVQTSGIFDLVGIIIVIGIIGFLAVLVIVAAIRFFKRGKEYVAKTDHLGPYTLVIRKQSSLKGNININNSFLVADTINRLKKVPKIIEDSEKLEAISIMEKMWKDGILYAYDMRVTEAFKTELPDHNVMLLSPNKIDETMTSWQDTKGEWSITGSVTDLFRRFPRNVQCSEFTEYFDVNDIHGFKKRVYVLAPYVDAIDKRLMANPQGKVVKDVMGKKKVYINIINLPNKEELAKLAVFLPSLNEYYKEVEIRDQELKNVIEQRDKAQKFADDQKMIIEGLKGRLKTHPLYGYEKPIFPVQPKTFLAIAGICLAIGFMVAKIGQVSFITQYEGLDYILFFAALAITLFAIKMFEKKSTDQQFTTEELGTRY